jgi:phosphoribosylanthranilate isomerase
MVGFVFFPPSPRHLSLETARANSASRPRAARQKVALTVDADDATLANIVEALQPDMLQLHGKETVARLRDIKQKFGLPVMKALRSRPRPISRRCRLCRVADRILFDARAPKERHPPRRPRRGVRLACCWKISISKLPFMVSGGLDAGNVAEACASRAPAASMCPRASSARPASRIPR